MFKKFQSFLCLLLAVTLLFSMTGCSGSKKDDKKKPNNKKDKPSADTSSTYISDEPENPIEEDPGDTEWEEIVTDDPEGEEYQELEIQNNHFVTDFKGLNYVFHPYAYLQDHAGRNYTEKQLKDEVSRIERMGVKMIRSYYGSALAWNPTKQAFDFESEDMQRYYTYCRDMQSIGVDLAVTANWSLADFLNDSSDNFSSVSFGAIGFGVAGDLAETCRRYRSFMSQTATAFRAHGIQNVKYFLGYTECNNTFSKGKNSDETLLVRREYEKLYPIFDAAITALDAGLKDSGLRNSYKIVAPCDNWRADDGSETYSRLVRYTLNNLYDKVDIIGSHRGYDRAGKYIDDHYYFIPQDMLQECRNEAVNAKKEFWIDEYNVATSENTNSAEALREKNKEPYKGTALGAMTASVLNMGASNVFLWALADQQWPNNNSNNGEFIYGLQIQGYLPSLLESYTPFSAWYSASMITKYLGSGKAYYCPEGDSTYTAYVERDDGNITVVVTNYTAEEANVKLAFEKSVGGKTFYRHVYNPGTVTPTPDAQLIGVSGVAYQVTTGFYDKIPPMGVAVYTTCK